MCNSTHLTSLCAYVYFFRDEMPRNAKPRHAKIPRNANKDSWKKDTQIEKQQKQVQTLEQDVAKYKAETN